VFVVHGESDAAESFAQSVRDTFGHTASVPQWGEIFDLETRESEIAEYGEEAAEHIIPRVDEEMDDLRGMISTLTERYLALKEEGVLKGYRMRRFKEEIEDVKSHLSVIKEKM
ncbi:MAG: hypothetical protein ACRCUT_13490, partial [Spirochaetota bacterium]